MDFGIKGPGQRNSKGLFGETEGGLKKKKKRKGERERKVGKLFCAPLLGSLKLECTGLKVIIQKRETQVCFGFTPV